MRNGQRVVTNEPLKEAKTDDDVSVSMKLEVYPNRDSTVFMERFGMQDCHTFIRGTYRFAGFSSVSLVFLTRLILRKPERALFVFYAQINLISPACVLDYFLLP